jgi:hypothetical protein
MIGFVTGAQPLGRNYETKGWAINENKALEFGGSGIQACPSEADGSYSIWLQGVDEPGWNKNCKKIDNWVSVQEKPVGCEYSQE